MGQLRGCALIQKSVQDAIKTELGAYKVDKEQHYQDHLWLSDLREWFTDIKSSFWKSLVGMILFSFLVLLVLGFILWSKMNIVEGVAK